jgi:hypothetical protein
MGCNSGRQQHFFSFSFSWAASAERNKKCKLAFQSLRPIHDVIWKYYAGLQLRPLKMIDVQFCCENDFHSTCLIWFILYQSFLHWLKMITIWFVGFLDFQNI